MSTKKGIRLLMIAEQLRRILAEGLARAHDSSGLTGSREGSLFRLRLLRIKLKIST
jgi:hypothetical protein